MGKKKKNKKNTTNNKPKQSQPKNVITNLEVALQNVEAAFREGKKAGITVKKKKWRDSTYETYQKTMVTLLNELAKIEGPNSKRLLPRYMNGTTWDRFFEKMADRYEEGTLTAGTIQRSVHAIEAFRQMINNTTVCGKDTKIRVGDKEVRLDYLKDRGVYRSKDEVTAIKATQKEVDLVQFHMNTTTKSGKTSLIVNQLQNECGGRIKSIFKLEVGDIDFDKKTITFRNDKNNFTRTVPMTKEAERILTDACAGKKVGSPVFTLKYQDGNDMTFKDSVKTVQYYTNNAAKAAGVSREDRRFTTHSNRKRYAQKLYDQTRYMSKEQLKKAIGNYCRMQGSNRDIIVERMHKELDRINTYRKMNGLPKKAFSHEDLRRMYVSLHLGHSRIDVVAQSYIVPDKIRKKYSK